MAATDIVLEEPVLGVPPVRHRSDRPDMTRLVSIDLLRGAVMVLMALDHAYFFFHPAHSAPEYMPQSSTALFFTRWITHFCAPAFFFLAGTGAFLSFSIWGHSISQVSRFLLIRGLWLLLLNFTVIGYAWTFLFPYGYGDVIWAFGLSMLLMALIVRLPLRWIAAFSLGMIAIHNLLDHISPLSFGRFAVLWSVLHCPGTYAVGSHYFFTLFTLIPWVGVMAAGFAFGPLLLTRDRRKVMLLLGATLTMAFFVLRALNLYGNSSAGLRPGFPDYLSAGPWTLQSSVALTIASFFNTLKYPASLQFLLMTLGPVLMTLAWLDNVNPKHGMARILLVFGQVPFFYYTLHLFFLHTIAVYVAMAFHQPAAWLLYGGPLMLRIPPGYGHGLPFIYAMWLGVLVLLYLPCKWLMNFKQQHAGWWWLRYI